MKLLANGVPHVAEVCCLQALKLCDNELIGTEVLCMGDGIVDSVGAAAGKRVLELLRGLTKLLLEPCDAFRHLVWTALELGCGGIEHACALLKIRDGALARYCFDATDI